MTTPKSRLTAILKAMQKKTAGQRAMDEWAARKAESEATDWVAVCGALEAAAKDRAFSNAEDSKFDIERAAPFGAHLSGLELRAYNDLLPSALVIIAIADGSIYGDAQPG